LEEEEVKHSNSIFTVIKTAFQPILEKGISKGAKDLKTSEQLPLVIMVVAGLSSMLVSLITLTAYIFREYLNEYVNFALVWSAFALSLLTLFFALQNARKKELRRWKTSNILFSLYFIFNFFVIIIFQAFYQFQVTSTFIFLISNASLSFLVAFIRKIGNLGFISYFVAIALPLYFFTINVNFYLPYLLFTSLAFLIFAEYVGNGRVNIFVSLISFVLYYFLLRAYASAENKYFFLSFVFLFSYLYLFFDFIVYKAGESSISAKQKFSKLDYAIILLIQAFIIFSVFIFFSNNHYSIALVFLLNALPFLISYIAFRQKFNKEANTIILSIGISYLLFSVATLFHNDTTTLVFISSVLAIIIIYWAFLKDKKNLRKYSYFIVTGGIFFMFTGFVPTIGLWGIKLLHLGFYKFIYALLLASALLFAMHNNKQKVIANEGTFYSIVKSFVALWFSFLYFMILWHTVPFIWTIAFLALPFYLLLYFGRLQKNMFIEVLAYFGIILIAFVSIIIAYYGIVDSWLTTLYSPGFYYLLFFGFMMIILRYLVRLLNTTQDFEHKLKYRISSKVKVYKLSSQNQSIGVLTIIDNILQLWIIFLLLLFIKYYTSYWFSFIALIPAFVLISWAYIYEQNFSKYLGFLIYGLVAFKIITYTFATQTGVSLFNLLQIGFFISLIWFTRINVFYFNKKISLNTVEVKLEENSTLQTEIKGTFDRIGLFFTALRNLKFELKEVEANQEWKRKRINRYFALSMSIWFSVFMFFLGFYLKGELPAHHYGYNMAFISMFALLYIAGRLEHSTIENIALVNGVLLLAGLTFSFIQSGFSFHLSDQPLFGIILAVQVYFSLITLLKFYQNFVQFSFNDDMMYYLNRLALFLLPFIIFYLGYRKLKFLIGFLPWIVLTVSIVLSEIYKLRSLVYESIFWLLVASIFVFMFPIPSVTLAGLPILIPFVIYKGGLKGFIKKEPRYELLPTFTVFYTIFAIFRVYLMFENDFSGGYFLASTFIFLLLFFQNYLFPVKKMNRLLYYMGVGLILVGFLFFYTDTNFAYDYRSSSYRLISVVFMPFSLMIMHKLLFNPKAYPGYSFIVELFLVNIYYFFTYSLLIYYFTSQITHLTITIALFLHGIIILFFSVKPKYNLLAIIALFVFLLATLKLFIVDIEEFSIVAKLSLFMLIGGLFFAAAIYYNNKRKAFLLKKKELEQQLATPQ